MNHWLKLAPLFLALLALSIMRYALPADRAAARAHAAPSAALTATLRVETVANLGVAAGSSALPRHVALDRLRNHLVLLSDGDLARQEGNRLTVYDLAQGEIVDHLEINQGDHEPLDLQVDSEANLIYALWRDRYGASRPVLTVIDSNLLQIVQEIPDVEAFTLNNGLLYLANADGLTAVNLSNNSLEQARRVTLAPAAATGPLAVSPTTNRLYLARSIDGSQWTVDFFEADALTPGGSYTADSAVLNVFPVPESDELLLVLGQNGYRLLYRINTSGELLELPYELGPYSGAAGIALAPDGETLFFSSGLYASLDPASSEPGPALVGLNSRSLLETHHISLLTNVDDLVLTENMAFAVFPYDHYLYLIDLERSAFDLEKTVIQVRDVLVDSDADLIYVSDSANRIRKLNRESLAVLAEVKLRNNGADFGFRAADWSGELALDPTRRRLYVSGLPAVVLDSDNLAEFTTLEPGGQIALAPGSDRLYLSNCGVTVLAAASLTRSLVLPESTRRPDDLIPNPCVTYSRLDGENQWLYSLAPNGVPGSNSGNHLLVYDVAAAPSLVFSDTNISITGAEPDPTGQRAFISTVRHSNRRLRTLTRPADRYVNQLLGLWGTMRYSPVSSRLYLGDRDHARLLALAGDTLDVIDSLALPPVDDYRLVELDPATDRLYLAGATGQLLVAAPGAEADVVLPATNPAREPTSVVSSLSNPSENTVFARIEARFDQFSTEPRLYSSANTGQSWIDLSQNLPAMPLQAFAVSPAFEQDQTMFASLLVPGQAGGLYRSTSGGQSWQPAMRGLRDLWVEKLFIAPDFAATGLIFASTTYGGLHASSDGGQSWSPLAALDPAGSFPASSAEYAVAFGGDGTILASQALPDQMYGVYRAALAADGTISAWQPVLDLPVRQLALSPDGQTALAFGTAFWRSTDGGQSWEIGGTGLTGVDNLQPASLIFSPTFAQDQTVYFFFSDRAGSPAGILYRSPDGGQTWQPWRSPDSAASFTAITMTPAGEFLLGDANAGLVRLAPEALNWASSTLPTTPFPIDDLAVANSQTVFAVSARHGLYVTTNGGRSWQRTSYPARAFSVGQPAARLALSPAYAADQTLYVASGLSLHRSTDGGQSWQQLSLGPDSATFQARQVALSPDFERDQTLLASTPAAVYRSTDGGQTWQPVLPADIEAFNPDVLTFAPDSQTAYARFGYGGQLYRSRDGGQSWQPQATEADEFFTLLDSAATADGALYAIVEYERQLLQTGPQATAWRNNSETLPDDLTSLTALASLPDGSGLVIAGQGGLFTSLDGGQTWQPVSRLGLPDSVTPTRLAASQADLFLALEDGRIYKTTGRLLDWTEISIVK